MMKSFIRAIGRRLAIPFAWEEVRDQGVWVYSENGITGQRKAVRRPSCHQPLNFEWLTAGTLPAIVIDGCKVEKLTEKWVMPSAPRTPPSRPSR